MAFGLGGSRTTPVSPTAPVTKPKSQPTNFGDYYIPFLTDVGKKIVEHSPFASLAETLAPQDDATPPIERPTPTPTPPPASAPPLNTSDFAGPPTSDVLSTANPVRRLTYKDTDPTWQGIKSRAYNPSKEMADWTGAADPVRGVNIFNLSQAQTEADLGAHAMLDARQAAARNSILQSLGPDPQDEALRAIERTAKYESLMPRGIERPLYGKPGEGAFTKGPDGVYRFNAGPTRTRAVEPLLEQYSGQKAIDRAAQQQQFQENLAYQMEGLQKLAALKASPAYLRAKPQEQAQAEEATLAPYKAREAAYNQTYAKLGINMKDPGGIGQY
jgi:hypothetical protein